MSRQIQGLQSTVFVQACFDIAVLSGAYSHRLCYLFPARAGLLWLFFSMVYSGTKTSSSSWCCSNLADVPQTARQGIDTQQDFSCFMLGYFCLITHTEVKKKTKKKNLQVKNGCQEIHRANRLRQAVARRACQPWFFTHQAGHGGE